MYSDYRKEKRIFNPSPCDMIILGRTQILAHNPIGYKEIITFREAKIIVSLVKLTKVFVG